MLLSLNVNPYDLAHMNFAMNIREVLMLMLANLRINFKSAKICFKI